MAGLEFALAGEGDDAALRQLLRESPMPGSVQLTFEREPSYFQAAALEGPLHQTIIARARGSAQVVGMGSRSVRPLYLNGAVQPVGYLGHLRTSAEHGWGLALARYLARAFRYCHDLHADGRAPFYLLSVVAGNRPAERVLESGLPGMPRLRPYTRMFTYAVAPRRRPALPLPGGLRLRRGSDEWRDAVLDCLQRNGLRRQFAPHWEAESLFGASSAPGLRPSDFVLAVDGERVSGCVALWDQTAFKQCVVRGYAGGMARWRRLINGAARLGGWPELPPVGATLKQCYLSHLAIDADDPAVFAALLRAAYTLAAERGCHTALLGLSEANPLRRVVRGYPHLAYLSQIYLVAWSDGQAAVEAVDGRVPGPEIAVL